MGSLTSKINFKMTKKLSNILLNIKILKTIGTLDREITGINLDSRKIKPDNIFVAINGFNQNGHLYIYSAIKNGAKTIICEELPEKIEIEITYIQTNNSNFALGQISTNFYDNPTKKIKIIGITGTNGKTTTATLLFELFKELGYKVGLVSTIKKVIHDTEIKVELTTPDAVSLNKLFYEMVQAGCEYCFMEVSSHAVAQKRIEGVNFFGGIFSNITHEHLDFHKTFAEYIKAKKLFFDNLDKNAFALTNLDDKNGLVMLQNTKARKFTYALKTLADFKTKIIESHFDGTLLNINNTEIWTQFVGNFNAYNLTAVYATAIILKQNKDEVLTILSKLIPVSGRFETVRVNGITAIIDYAHTPDALKNVLKTIKELQTDKQTLITVIGAGGDRDKQKRPVMARIAADYSERVILTSDNPRSEKPETIIEDMYKGLESSTTFKVVKITNRKEAIKTAVMLAKKGDIILIAGKGHETYQEINGIRTHFDDKEIVKKINN